MNKRTFNKHLNACCSGKKNKKLDVSKVKMLPDEVKDAMVLLLVRHRVPIVVEFLTGNIDRRMLAGCGYLYTTKGKEYIFLHTGEHRIR